MCWICDIEVGIENGTISGMDPYIEKLVRLKDYEGELNREANRLVNAALIALGGIKGNKISMTERTLESIVQAMERDSLVMVHVHEVNDTGELINSLRIIDRSAVKENDRNTEFTNLTLDILKGVPGMSQHDPTDVHTAKGIARSVMDGSDIEDKHVDMLQDLYNSGE